MATDRRPGIDSTALFIGTVLNGIAIYAVAALGTRTYGATTFAPVSVLWTFWALSVAVFTFPIQHWVIRRVTIDQHEGGIRAALPRLALIVLIVSLALAGVAWIGRHRFFGDSRAVWPALVALITIGASVTGLARGVLAGRRRFVAVAGVIAGENVLRLLLCALVAYIGADVEVFGIAFAAGAVIVVGFPSSFRLAGETTPRMALVGFLGGLAGSTALAQIVLTSGPAVLSAIGGSATEVTALFVTMALFRAPYLIGLGLATQITAPLTDLVRDGRHDTFKSMVRWTIGAAAAAALLGAGIGWVAGSGIVELVFGTGTAPPAEVASAVAAGSVLAIGTLVLTLSHVAVGITGIVAVWWSVAIAAGTVVIGLWDGTELGAVAGGFLAAETVALAVMGWSLLRPDLLTRR